MKYSNEYIIFFLFFSTFSKLSDLYNVKKRIIIIGSKYFCVKIVAEKPKIIKDVSIKLSKLFLQIKKNK
jgi:flagellar motor component MotA